MRRCEWCGNDPLYIVYHDEDWGVPVHDDRLLFEIEAFDSFIAEEVAAYTEHDIQRLLADAGIVRNRLKIESAVKNARGVLAVREEFDSLDAFLWRYVDHAPRQNTWQSMSEIPSKTERSDMMSKDLKKRGFNFVGSTICYAFMQSVGMVNDHVVECFRYREIERMA